MSPLALRVFFILRFIFRFLYRFHFHHILLGFTHSSTRRSPSVLMFIRSLVRVHLVVSFLLIHSWLLDSYAVLHNVMRYYITSSTIQLIFSGLSSSIISRVRSSVRTFPRFHSSLWVVYSQPPTHSWGFLMFSLRLKTPH